MQGAAMAPCGAEVRLSGRECTHMQVQALVAGWYVVDYAPQCVVRTPACTAAAAHSFP